MRFRKLLIAWLVSWGLACVLPVGCTRHVSNSSAGPKILFHKLDDAELIRFNIRTREGLEFECTLPDKLRSKFVSAFEDAVPDPEPLKYDTRGRVQFYAGGKYYDALLLWINEGEYGLRISSSDWQHVYDEKAEYWKHVDQAKVDELTRECIRYFANAFAK